MDWIKVSTVSESKWKDCGGKMSNSAIYEAETNGNTFIAYKNPNQNHGKWVLRHIFVNANGVKRNRPMTVKSLAAAKVKAEAIASELA